MTVPVLLNIEKLCKIQNEANELLQSAMLDERGQNWKKVVDKYKRLIKLVLRKNLPSSFIPPPNYNALLYESYFHLGVGLQHLGRNKEAIIAFTNAMTSMNLRKNGCMAGCNSSTCFHTPALAKRAFSLAKVGDMKAAFTDIEKAIVLDTMNPDLYCVRALMFNTKRESKKAMDDVNVALSISKRYITATLLKGNLDQPLKFSFLGGLSMDSSNKKLSDAHAAAVRMDPDTANYTDVMDINHPKMTRFWTRYFRSLNLPRTVMNVDIISPMLMKYNDTISTQKVIGHRSMEYTTDNKSSLKPPILPSSVLRESVPRSRSPSPFRCGTPIHGDKEAGGSLAIETRSRRISYGEAIRSYSQKRKDSQVSEYIQSLVDHSTRPPIPPRKLARKQLPQVKVTRSNSDVTRRNSRQSRPITASSTASSRDSGSLKPQRIRRDSISSNRSCPTMIPTPPKSTEDPVMSRASRSPQQSRQSSRRTHSASPTTYYYSKKEASEYALKKHGVKVFETIDINGRPRMYNKPWSGDKLPVADKIIRPKSHAFR